MAELVYAFDLKSNDFGRMGSSPISGTREICSLEWIFCVLVLGLGLAENL